MNKAELAQFSERVRTEGWSITQPVVELPAIATLCRDLSGLQPDVRGGVRNILERSSVRALATSPAVRQLAESVLGSSCFAVRATLFDKTAAANWKVIWHQDVTIATQERADIPGFTAWSNKGGVPHVQPPVEYLQQMLAIRVHLDPCTADNGPVRVISRSHLHGRLSDAEVAALVQREGSIPCLVEEGGVLAFRPLLLHASSAAITPLHRRVIHIEFAGEALPVPLEWHLRVA